MKKSLDSTHPTVHLLFISAGEKVLQQFPGLRILTSEIHPIAPTHFGQKYFGTD